MWPRLIFLLHLPPSRTIARKERHFGFEFPCAHSRLRILVPSSTRTARLVVRGPTSHLAAPPAGEGALVLDSLLGKQQLVGNSRPWEAHKAGHCSSDFSSESVLSEPRPPPALCVGTLILSQAQAACFPLLPHLPASFIGCQPAVSLGVLSSEPSLGRGRQTRRGSHILLISQMWFLCGPREMGAGGVSLSSAHLGMASGSPGCPASHDCVLLGR